MKLLLSNNQSRLKVQMNQMKKEGLLEHSVLKNLAQQKELLPTKVSIYKK
jgi:hypothetical protein